MTGAMMRQLILLIGLWFAPPLWANNCNGNVLLFSDQSQLIEEYSNKVRVYVPLRIKVSNRLLDCADEIWIEPIDSHHVKFYGPTMNKNGKLLDNQFKRVKLRNGFYRTDLTERETQLWVRLQHYSFFPAGSYFSRIRVSVVKDAEVVAEQLLDMEYYSAPKIAIELDKNSQGKITGSDGSYQIDLGELEPNLQFYWGIKVLSNSAYDIVLDSEHNGLRNIFMPDALIEYTIGFDHVKISSQEQLIRRYDFSASVKNTWFGFSFELGSIENKPAGYYQDNLSLTIYPY